MNTTIIAQAFIQVLWFAALCSAIENSNKKFEIALAIMFFMSIELLLFFANATSEIVALFN